MVTDDQRARDYRGPAFTIPSRIDSPVEAGIALISFFPNSTFQPGCRDLVLLGMFMFCAVERSSCCDSADGLPVLVRGVQVEEQSRAT